MISEPFALGNSPLHRCDPRIRLVAAAAYSFVVALSHEFPALSAALVLSMVLVSLARLQVREVLKRLAVVNGLVVLLWLVIPFTFPGEALFRIGPLHASRIANRFGRPDHAQVQRHYACLHRPGGHHAVGDPGLRPQSAAGPG